MCQDTNGLVTFIASRNAFRAKSTMRSNMSCMRLMGEFLVQRKVWRQNPLRRLVGPRVDPRSPLPRRLGKAELEKFWTAASAHPIGYYRQLSVTVLSLL